MCERRFKENFRIIYLASVQKSYVKLIEKNNKKNDNNNKISKMFHMYLCALKSLCV